MKHILLFFITTFLTGLSLNAQVVFTQNFNSFGDVEDYITTTDVANQFHVMGVSTNTVTLDITNNKIEIVKSGKGNVGFARLAGIGVHGFLKYSMELTMASSAEALDEPFSFSVGNGFNDNLKTPDDANIHSQFFINTTATSGQFTLKSGTTTSAAFSGAQTLTWFVNNTGGSVQYTAPDGSTKTLADDKSDLWVGTASVVLAAPAVTATNDLTDFRLASSGNFVLTMTIDDISVEALTSLPVDLVSFDAEKSVNGIVLNWKTASESNNSHFDILRSTDGKSFIKIGEVEGAQPSLGLKNYSYVDKNANTGVNYYQLKQVDLNGEVKIYGPVAAQFDIHAINTELSLLAEEGIVKIMVTNVSTSQPVEISLYNTQGQLLSKSSSVFQTGTNYVNLPVIPSGLNVIHVAGTDFRISKKFISSF